MFLEAGAAPYGGRSPPPQALPAVSPSGRKAAPPWWEDGSGLRWGDGSGLLVGEDGSGLLRTGMAAGCCGRGRQRAAADGDGSGLLRTGTAAGCCGRTAGRPCGEAAHRPRRRRGGGLRPGGAEGLPAVLLRGAAARPQKNQARKTAVLRAWFGAYR